MDQIQNFFEMISESLINIDIGSTIVLSLILAMSISLLLLIFKKQFVIDDKPLTPKRQDATTITQTPPSVSNPIPALKSKHKKSKKLSKQNTNPKSIDSAEDSISEKSSSDEQLCKERKLSRGHVDFADTVETVDNVKTKRSIHKKEKIKPILVNKHEKCEKSEIDTPVDDPKVNNFEEILPKDDVELLRSRSCENHTKTSSRSKDRISRSKQKKLADTQLEQTSNDLTKNNNDLLKELNNGPTLNVNLLIQLIQEHDMTKDEIQSLINFLLNKQQDTPDTNGDWTEGKSDQLQKLKKLLAEKEQVLKDEEEAHLLLQNKMRDIRSELNNEKLKFSKTIREKDELILSKDQELQNLSAQCHNHSEMISKLQSQINEYVKSEVILRNEMENFEIRISKESNKAQSQLMILTSKIKELQNLNEQLSSDNKMLHQSVSVQDNQLIHYQNECEQKQEIVRQLEESRKLINNLEVELTQAHIKDSQKSMDLEELHQKKSEIDQQFQCEISNLKALNKQIFDDKERIISQLRSENEQLKESEQTKLYEIREYNEIVSELNEIINLNKETDNVYDSSKNVKLESKVNEIENFKMTMTELKHQLCKNRESQTDNLMQIEEMKKKMDHLNYELEKSTTEYRDLKENSIKKIVSLVTDLNEWQIKYKELAQKMSNDLQSSDELVHEYRIEIENLKSSMSENNSVLNETKLQLEEEIHKSNEKSHQLESLEKLLADKEHILKDEKESYLSLQNKMRDIQNELSGQELKLLKITREKEEMISSKDHELKNLSFQTQSQSQVITKLKLENEQLTESENEKLIEIQNLNKTVSDLTNEINRMNELKESLHLQIRNEADNYIKEINDLKDALHINELNIKESLESKQNEINNLQTEIIDLNSQLRNAHDLHKETANDNLEQIETMKKELNQLHHELERANTAYGDIKENSAKTILDLNNDVNVLKQKLTEVNEMIREKSTELQSVRELLQKYEIEVGKLESCISDKNSLISKMKLQFDEQVHKYDELSIDQSNTINALNEAEMACKSMIDAFNLVSQNAINRNNEEKETLLKELFSKTFPSIQLPNRLDEPFEVWLKSVEVCISEYANELNSTKANGKKKHGAKYGKVIKETVFEEDYKI